MVVPLRGKTGSNFSALRSIVQLTYHEYVNCKIFIVSIALYSLVILLLLFGFGKKTDYFVNLYFLSFLFYFSLIFLILSGFDLFPRMIADGSLELILSRPITRIRLLIYKYIATVLIIPIGTFLFFLVISFLYFMKSGIYEFVHIRVFLFTSITYAVYEAALIPAALLFYRSNLSLLICLILIMVNVLPNLVYGITGGNIELTNNFLIGSFYHFSPRLVELCGLAVRSRADLDIVYIHSAMFVSGCLVLSYFLIKRKDF